MKVNIYIGLSVGLVTFVSCLGCVSLSSSPSLFCVDATNLTASSFLYRITGDLTNQDNIVLILLSIAECVFVALLWSPESSKKIKELIDLPESYMQFIDSHLSYGFICIEHVVSS